jgi:hypothetical protein
VIVNTSHIDGRQHQPLSRPLEPKALYRFLFISIAIQLLEPQAAPCSALVSIRCLPVCWLLNWEVQDLKAHQFPSKPAIGPTLNLATGIMSCGLILYLSIALACPTVKDRTKRMKVMRTSHHVTWKHHFPSTITIISLIQGGPRQQQVKNVQSWTKLQHCIPRSVRICNFQYQPHRQYRSIPVASAAVNTNCTSGCHVHPEPFLHRVVMSHLQTLTSLEPPVLEF